jgi:hypothetical protein
MDSLPVLYYANKKEWQTSEVFNKWLMNCVLELQRKSRKIVLGQENCAVEPHAYTLKHVQLEFLSPSIKSLVEPMNMRIIKVFEDLMWRKVGKVLTSIMFLDIIHRLVHFLKNTTFRRLDSVSVLR